jgi:hypothetical protein
MSLHEYLCSQAISKGDPPFYALLMAMIRGADSDNIEKIKRAWPEKFAEMQARYHAPGGILPEDGVESLGDQVVDASGAVLWVCSACGERHSQALDTCENCDTARGAG